MGGWKGGKISRSSRSSRTGREEFRSEPRTEGITGRKDRMSSSPRIREQALRARQNRAQNILRKASQPLLPVLSLQ